MKQHIIYGTLGTADTFVPHVSGSSAQLTALPLFIAGSSMLDHGMGRALTDLRALSIHPTEMGLDFLVLAAHVYAADTRISRKDTSQDGWTREIEIIVPVSAPASWIKVIPDLEEQLRFLTGDIWTVGFRARPEGFEALLPDQSSVTKAEYDQVQLFSGGLDSLVGAIDNISQKKSTLLISHAGDGPTSDAQNNCFTALRDSYKESRFERLRLWMNIPHALVTGVEPEDTTRGRSFLFFSLGVLAGTGLAQPFTLQTPENGLIALNVPLDVLRLGSLSTHTTHPYYMNLWNRILEKLGIAGRVENPYWALTKGEMVQNCLDPELLQKVTPLSLSCSSPSKSRWKGLGIIHCGYCLPCLIRRASLALKSDQTPYALSDLSARNIDTLKAEGQQIRSFQIAVSRITSNPAICMLLVHKSGPLPLSASTRQELSEVYRRGMLEVGRLIENVRTKPES